MLNAPQSSLRGWLSLTPLSSSTGDWKQTVIVGVENDPCWARLRRDAEMFWLDEMNIMFNSGWSRLSWLPPLLLFPLSLLFNSVTGSCRMSCCLLVLWCSNNLWVHLWIISVGLCCPVQTTTCGPDGSQYLKSSKPKGPFSTVKLKVNVKRGEFNSKTELHIVYILKHFIVHRFMVPKGWILAPPAVQFWLSNMLILTKYLQNRWHSHQP